MFELGNFQAVGVVRDIPELSFTLDVLDVGTQVEALMCGADKPDDDTVNPLGNGTSVPGTVYDLALNQALDVVSPFKKTLGNYAVVKGVGVPQLVVEQAQYRYGYKQNAGENFTLRGDSIYYIPGAPFLGQYAGDGTTVNYPFASSTYASNEVQTVDLTGTTGGTYTLTFPTATPATTAAIAFGATTAAVQSALEVLPNIGLGNVTVTGTPGALYTITFVMALGGKNQPQLTANSTLLTGGTATVNTTTPGGTAIALKALKYTELGVDRYALNVSVDGVRQNLGTDYTETTTSITFTTAPTALAKIRIVWGSTKDASDVAINVTYPQLVNSSLAIKPAAIRGRDIRVKIGGLSDTNKWHDVQSVQVDWKVNLEADYEFGSAHAVARDFVNPPDVTGTIEIKSITVDALFAKLNQITGVNSADVVGPQSSVTLPIIIELLNPDSGGTSHVPAGTVLKTLLIPDARFVIPGYEGRVSQKMMSQFQFISDKGILKIVKGALTSAQYAALIA